MAKAKIKAKEEVKPREPRKLAAIDFQLKETVQAQYTALVPTDTIFEDCMEPMFWTHVAAQMPTMSEVTLIPKDGSWYGRVFVRYSDRTSAKVAPLEYHDLNTMVYEDTDDSDFGIDFTTAEGFRVIRKADSTVLSKGHNTREDAAEWMVEHNKAMAA